MLCARFSCPNLQGHASEAFNPRSYIASKLEHSNIDMVCCAVCMTFPGPSSLTARMCLASMADVSAAQLPRKILKERSDQAEPKMFHEELFYNKYSAIFCHSGYSLE